MSYILFDVGANQGQDSLNRTRDDVNVTTYAFEPIPEFVERLNTARNNGYTWEYYRRSEHPGTPYADRYHLYACALSDYNGTSTFHIADNNPLGDWGASSLYPFVDHVAQTWPGRTDLKTTRTITVQVSRFDTWYQNNNLSLDRIDYFHCDTQGSDLRVLKGMNSYIDLIQQGVVECARDQRAKLYAENHTVEEMQDFLSDHGFKIIDRKANDPYNNEFNLYFAKK